MKIAFLMYSFIPHFGGAQIFSYNLMKNLSRRGHEVHLYIPYIRYIQLKRLKLSLNFKVYPIFRKEYFLAKYFPFVIRKKLTMIQKIEKYDLWQVIGSYPAGWVGLGLIKSVPIIVRCHGSDIQKDINLNYGQGLIPEVDEKIKEVLIKASHLVALTKTVKKCYYEYNIPKSKITEIPNGVSLSNFKNINANLKKKLDLDKNQKLIISVGRYHKKKGYELITKTCHHLLKHDFYFKWIIVGKGVSVLKPIINKEKLDDVIILMEEIGVDNDSRINLKFPSKSLLELYKSADLFVMTSLLETFGMVLIEAMAAGLPVISFDAPGCRDVVKNKYNGILIETENTKKLALGILKIFKSDNLKFNLIKNAKSSVKEYSWSNVTDNYIRLYDRFIGKDI